MTTVEERNVATLKRAYHLWNQDKETAFHHWVELMDPKITWRSLADGAKGMEFTSFRSSRESVIDYFQQLARDWEMISYDVDEFIAQGDRVVMVGRCAYRNRRTGRQIATPKVDIFRMKHDKIVDFFEFYDTAMVLAAAS